MLAFIISFAWEASLDTTTHTFNLWGVGVGVLALLFPVFVKVPIVRGTLALEHLLRCDSLKSLGTYVCLVGFLILFVYSIGLYIFVAFLVAVYCYFGLNESILVGVIIGAVEFAWYIALQLLYDLEAKRTVASIGPVQR